MIKQISHEILFEHLHLILLFGFFGLLLNWIAKRNGFFILPLQEDRPPFHLRGMQVIAPFGIYLLVSLLLAPVVVRTTSVLFATKVQADPMFFAGMLQLSSLIVILGGLTLYASKQDRGTMRNIWMRGEMSKSRFISDLFLGALTWVIAFPLVVLIAQICDLLLYLFFGVESYEQVAVRFMKTALGSPPLLTAALLTIIVAAPIIEEWLFRGFLQTFFRKYLGTKAAILLSAFSFALFHLSTSQGWGNVSLALSLFTFACYLGFIYERQRSLFAPISLHMTFNTVSALRILLMPES
ncbi:MAG: CPBP family intramembrane glutamic endopeptidase [Chlamydiales bacterium]